MKQKNIPILLMFFLYITHTAHTANAPKSFGRSFFSQRPQGQNQARYLVQEASLYPLCTKSDYFDLTSVTFEYTNNYKRHDLGKYLFFNGTNSMVFGGSNILPNLKDVDAINFFLADDFRSQVTANPQVQNNIVDIHTRANLSKIWAGLYAEIDLPVVQTKWNVNLKENIFNPGTTIAANELSNPVVAPAPVNSVIQAWNGTAVDTANFPLITEPLNFARVNGYRQSDALADVRLLLGYNIACANYHHLGINIRAVAPTGTRPNGEFLFEPIAGNGHHAALGGGVQMHYAVWSNDADTWLNIWFDGYLNHFFKARQKRTFDWENNGVGSRYLWLKKFNAQGNTLTELVRGPNVTTLDCDVSVKYIGEATILFDFVIHDWIFDFGYNAWGRSKESVSITGTIEPGVYGIKGNTLSTPNGMTAADLEIAQNTKINGSDAATTGNFTPATALKTQNLNPCSAESPSALSHKFFAHFGKTWFHYEHTPFLGIGGEIEIACSCARNRALSQYGGWIKGGLSF